MNARFLVNSRFSHGVLQRAGERSGERFVLNGLRETRRVKMEGLASWWRKVRTTPNVATRGIKSQSELGYILGLLRTAVSADLGGSTGMLQPSVLRRTVGSADRHCIESQHLRLPALVRIWCTIRARCLCTENLFFECFRRDCTNGTIGQRFSHDDIGADAEGGMAALTDRIPVTQSTHANVSGKGA